MCKKRRKIIIVIGARPNFIKVAPLLKEIKRYSNLNPILVHTGQHYDFKMSKIFFQDLEIQKPDYNLGIGSSLHGCQTGRIMIKFEKICLKEKPVLAIVIGDINSTLAGALVAAKLHIPVVHIEAGLRSFDMAMPEEINRILTDHISNFLFCPTKTAVKNLEKEGIQNEVYNVGDIMYDAFLENIKIAQRKSKILKKLKLKPKSYFLLTVHRPQNSDNMENLKKIIEAVGESRKKIVFPIHPRTEKLLKKIEIQKFKNLKIINPVGYLDMLILEKGAKKIITDSGGIQKEAYWLKIPCITLRKQTEWVETVKSGYNILTGTNKEKITKAIARFNPKRKQKKYFGNGKTAQKIVKILCQVIKN